jgi:hypothetical protein
MTKTSGVRILRSALALPERKHGKSAPSIDSVLRRAFGLKRKPPTVKDTRHSVTVIREDANATYYRINSSRKVVVTVPKIRF